MSWYTNSVRKHCRFFSVSECSPLKIFGRDENVYEIKGIKSEVLSTANFVWRNGNKVVFIRKVKEYQNVRNYNPKNRNLNIHPRQIVRQIRFNFVYSLTTATWSRITQSVHRFVEMLRVLAGARHISLLERVKTPTLGSNQPPIQRPPAPISKEMSRERHNGDYTLLSST
jgi:hypothetical protein